MAATDPSTPEARRFSIRLPHWRWLLLAAAILLVGSIGLSVWRPYHLEQQAIHEIQILGGEVVLKVAAPEWLYQIVGEERLDTLKIFSRVSQVFLTGSSVTDAELRPISDLKSLEYLSLDETPITDAGLVHLAALQSLTELHLEETQITDVGLLHLRRLTALETLNLNDTKISDAGLAHLDGLVNLAFLSLDETPITDAGLARLSGLRNLTMLGVRKTLVTESGIKALYRAIPTCQIQR
jgi:Leucine-rich repeat (LRR) protein